MIYPRFGDYLYPTGQTANLTATVVIAVVVATFALLIIAAGTILYIRKRNGTRIDPIISTKKNDRTVQIQSFSPAEGEFVDDIPELSHNAHSLDREPENFSAFMTGNPLHKPSKQEKWQEAGYEVSSSSRETSKEVWKNAGYDISKTSDLNHYYALPMVSTGKTSDEEALIDSSKTNSSIQASEMPSNPSVSNPSTNSGPSTKALTGLVYEENTLINQARQEQPK